MSLDSPASILYNSNGIEMAVSGGVAVPVSTSALLMAGITSDQTASFVKVAPTGEVFITGSLVTTPTGIQNVALTNTASVQVINTASVQVFNTASVRLVDVIAGTGSLSPITGVLVGGKDTAGNFQALRLTTNGTLFVTGNFDLTNTASVNVFNTASVQVVNTASVQIFNTASVQVFNTASVLVVGTASVREIPNGTSVLSGTNRSNTAQVILPANSNRRGALFFNDSNATMFLAYSASVTTTEFTVKLSAQSFYVVDALYTGVISGIWATAGSGQVRSTEVTA